MANARRIVIEFLGKDKSLGATADHADSKMHKLGGSLKKIGLIAGGALAAGAVVGGVALFKMAKGAADDEAAQKRLANTLKNTAGASKAQIKQTEQWIAKQGRLKGVTDDELRPALARLTTATHDVGKAQKLTNLAMDVSQGTGKSLKSVTEALMKAQNGNVSGLSRLGVKTKDAAGHTMSLDKITKSLALTYGGQASQHANTFQGKMERLKLVFDETKEAIGAKLLPILSKMGEWFLNKAMPAVSKFFGALSKGQGPLTLVGKLLRAVGHFIKDEVVPHLKSVVTSFKKAMGGGDGFKKSLKDMRPFLDLVKNMLKGLWVVIKGVAQIAIPLIVAGFKVMAKLLGVVGKVGKWLWNGVLQPVFKLIVRALAEVMNMWAKMLKALGHVPGFGWAKEAGRNMQTAANKTRELSDNIKKIPKNPKVTIHVSTAMTGAASAVVAGLGGSFKVKARAKGGSVRSGQSYLVGERGPEMFTPGGGGGTITPNNRLPGGGGPTIIIQGALDPAAVARQVQSILLAQKRRNGGAPLGLA